MTLFCVRPSTRAHRIFRVRISIIHQRRASSQHMAIALRSQTNSFKLICILFFFLFANLSTTFSPLVEEKEKFSHWKITNIIFSVFRVFFSLFVVVVVVVGLENVDDLYTHTGAVPGWFYTSAKILLIFMGFLKMQERKLLIADCSRRGSEWGRIFGDLFQAAATVDDDDYNVVRRRRFGRVDKREFVTATKCV